MAMAEKVIAAIWKSAGYDVQLPIQRITWQDAMDIGFQLRRPPAKQQCPRSQRQPRPSLALWGAEG